MTVTVKVKDKSGTSALLKVAPFRKEIRKTEPHKHNSYFEIIYLSEGAGKHVIDYKDYPIKPPLVFFVRKEQVHHWDITSNPKGYVLILKKGFVSESLDYELKQLISKASEHNVLPLSHHEKIEKLFALLVDEANFTVTEGLLKALLALLLEQTPTLKVSAPVSSDIFLSYKDLLSHSSRLQNNVAHYAHLLNISPQNLNFICRKNANQTASAILAEHIINEAKRLLLYTDTTIAEIAFAFGFSDSSHFIKYFKKYTEQTPKAFRLQS